jgi:hypothetical protein
MRRRPVAIFLTLFLAVIALSLTTLYFYKKSKGSDAESEVAALAKRVEKIVVVPADETPTVATVTDPQKLSGQDFFAGAKEGDKVLIYARAGKAILYDPAAGKVINIAPVNLDGEVAGAAQP